MYLTEKFANLVVGLDTGRIPQAAPDKGKACIQDCIGVTIAGSAEPIREPILQHIDAIGGRAIATLIGVGSVLRSRTPRLPTALRPRARL